MIRPIRSPPLATLGTLAACLLALSLASPVSAANAPVSGADQARQALAILQSDAPPEEKAIACKRIAVLPDPFSPKTIAVAGSAGSP